MPHILPLQKSTVHVYRLITKKTYEAEMFRRASQKLGLAQAVRAAEQQSSDALHAVWYCQRYGHASVAASSLTNAVVRVDRCLSREAFARRST
jgi:hypothetical protein